jgi:4'-phosphopantetheinyl transferase
MPLSKPFISISTVKCDSLTADNASSLAANDVLLYPIYLPHFTAITSDLVPFLSSTELNRAGRFHKEMDRNRFIICRSILKLVLAASAALDVQHIHFDFHSNKKPYLASLPWLHFNISHSGDFAVIALSRNEVGIDIEFISEDFDFTPLLPDIFAESEIMAIQNAVAKSRAFYTSWTRKEALVKGLGKGIDDDFKTIPCLDGQHSIDSSLLKTTQSWQVYSFELAADYLGAVAFESSSPLSKNLALYSLPTTLKGLLELTALRND